jgi:Anti-sigma factor NepR
MADDKLGHQGKKRHAYLDPIAIALRRLHDSVLEEPVPEQFLQLLARIEDEVDLSDVNRDLPN